MHVKLSFQNRRKKRWRKYLEIHFGAKIQMAKDDDFYGLVVI